LAHRYVANVNVMIHLIRSKMLRDKLRSPAVIGKFRGSVKLYRVVDGEELRKILDTGVIKGGDFAAPSERRHGASWGTNRKEVVTWGEGQRGKRLGHELFLMEIDGKGKRFFHMAVPQAELPEYDEDIPGSQFFETQIPVEVCNTGLGCSMEVDVRDVKQWFEVEPGGKLVKQTTQGLKEKAQGLGLKPRRLEVFYGAQVNLPPALAQGLSQKMVMQGPRYDDFAAQREVRMRYPKGKLPKDWQKALVKAAGIGPNVETEWHQDFTKAIAEAGRGDGQRTQAIVFKAIVEAAAPEHVVTIKGGYTLEAIWGKNPETGRLDQLWWGKLPVGRVKKASADSVLLRHLLREF
jgi:hypothetical protein